MAKIKLEKDYSKVTVKQYVDFVTNEGNDVGNFEFKKDTDGVFYAEEAFVTKKQKGLASIAYDYASKDGEKIKPSKRLKEDGIKFWSKSISSSYHKAKRNGSNPELVKAVEDLLVGEQQQEKAEKPIAESRREFREKARKYFDGLKKLGFAYDPERNAKEDIAFLKALKDYIKLEIDNGMVTFKGLKWVYV